MFWKAALVDGYVASGWMEIENFVPGNCGISAN
jgi:hypothetical protein